MTTDGGFGFGFGFDFDFEFDQGGNENFSKLLLSDDVVSHASSSTTSLFSFDTPKMLCFGDFCEEYESGSSQITTQSISSPVSKSSSDASINGLQNSSNCNKRRNGSASPKKDASASREQIGSKKIRSTAGHAKAKKKEKLGDRIATLQQLVSPYGKADTASVLHETMGYIRFLQNQVDVLCSPYLQRIPTTSRGENYECQKSIQGLKSKGLCLVPISGIVDMASSNGADLWSPVTSKAITPANVVDPRPSSIC